MIMCKEPVVRAECVAAAGGAALVTGMAGFGDPAFYGDRWAAVYDDHRRQMDPGPAVEFLAGLAGDGRVLELAIGTGRAALPLAARGITVEGIDASAAMTGPGPGGVRGLGGHRGVPPRPGAAARRYPDDHVRRPGDAPAAGGHPLQLAGRAGPDGQPGRPAAGRTLRRLGPEPVHRGQRQPHLRLPASLTSQPNAA